MSIVQALLGAARMPQLAWSFSRRGFAHRSRQFAAGDLEGSLAGQSCLVTGANQGIGLAIAAGLAKRDADVVLLCRSDVRGARAAENLNQLGAGRVSAEVVDIAELSSIRALLERLAIPAIDVLVHNAGALFAQRRETSDGLERTFALHVVGPEMLTRGLLGRLRRARGRVIAVSSGGMYSERLDVAAMIDPSFPFDGVKAYALAKRAQVVLADEWASREPQVAFYAMHPGWVDTAGVATGLPRFYRLTKRFLRNVEQGADSALWLAANRKLTINSGAFVFDRAEVDRHILPGTRADQTERHRLWTFLENRAESMGASSS